MFRRKKDEPTQAEKIRDVIEFLEELEPKQMDRLVTLAKEKRACSQKIDAFLGISITKNKNSDLEFEEME